MELLFVLAFGLVLSVIVSVIFGLVYAKSSNYDVAEYAYRVAVFAILCALGFNIALLLAVVLKIGELFGV